MAAWRCTQPSSPFYDYRNNKAGRIDKASATTDMILIVRHIWVDFGL